MRLDTLTRRPDAATKVAKPWSQTGRNILSALDASAESGLDGTTVTQRLRSYGRNRLQEAARRSAWLILADQFRNLIVALLAVASAVAFAFGEVIEGVAIFGVIIINALIGFFTELRAVRSMEALRKLGTVKTRVRRDGDIQEVEAESLVPGDIVILEGGDIVTADLRILVASKLQADESALTGESVPVGKNSERRPEQTTLAERTNMLYKGTALTRGSGEAVVVATGMDTELGQITSLVETAEEETTPLEKRLNRLGRKLIWATLIIAVFVIGTGILAGKETFLMIETGIALAVAAIPEGLPIVATIALARGMYRMARRNALINRLSSVETLGATNVIFTDKTGTLTENRMTMVRIDQAPGEVRVPGGEEDDNGGAFTRDGAPVDPDRDEVLREILEVGTLCNNAAIEGTQAVGDPLEVALLMASDKANISREQMAQQMPEEREVAFDPDVKMMATFHRLSDGYRVAVKGAPEPVLQACSGIRTADGDQPLDDQDRLRWLESNEQMAEEGLRVLALATKKTREVGEDPYRELSFLGLVGLHDPPRQDIRQAIDECRQAGVRVIMVTGDQPVTARNIAEAVGLIEGENGKVIHGQDLRSAAELTAEEQDQIRRASIFARVSPRQKLDLIEVHQKSGSVVAMTGDGVNDAPALKKADIGVAMGQRGTQVAREAADMVLKDDAFSTIVAAIHQGRVIFDNIRTFVVYLLSCNVSEILAVSLASVANAPLPILPLQILFLNLVTDVFPALALGVGEGHPAVMKRPARDPAEPILTRGHWLGIGGYSLVITAAVLGALALALNWLKMNPRQAVTVSFLTLAFAQLWHVFNMRDRGSGLFRNDITTNRYVWGALALCTGLLLMSVYLPGLSEILQLSPPGGRGWTLVAAMSLVPWAAGQLVKSRAQEKP
jgi:Ca2+-transporting ATPase